MWSYEGRIRLGLITALAVGVGAAFIPYGWVLWCLVGLVGIVATSKGVWFWRRVSAKLPVFLMLHAVNDTVVDPICPNNTIRPEELERLIRDLKRAGYTFQTATEAATTPVRRSMCLTFDDGFVDNYTVLFPILKRHEAKATLFVTNQGADDPAFLSAEQLREMVASGLVEIGGHTACHSKLGHCSAEETRTAIGDNARWLTEVLGAAPTSFAYPCGEYTEACFETLRALNIPFAFTMHKRMRPVADNPLLIHRQIIPRGKTPYQNYLLATRGRYKL